MIALRRLTTIALATAAALTAAPALAGSNPGGVGGPPGPEILPPNAAPGQCFSRRVTGPGGAYRWDRVECDSAYGGYGYGYGYGHGGRLDVQTQAAPSHGYGYQGGYAPDCGCGGYQDGYAYGGDHAGDRYGERRYDSRSAQSQYAYESSSYSGGYAYGRGGQGVSYPPPYGYGYVAAGRDEAGYLIWPGKTP